MNFCEDEDGMPLQELVMWQKRGTKLSFSHNAMCCPIKHMLAHIPHRSLLL